VLHILLAEDNPGDVFLVRRALAEHNISHVLSVVKDGAEALEFLARMGKTKELPCPDVLLLDVNLPKVDGSRFLLNFGSIRIALLPQ
jgi:CheY-like chemotaxis protein